jgi:hypothetical protein
MSFKAYAIKIETPKQAEILNDYLNEMEGVGWFSVAFRVNKRTVNNKYLNGLRTTVFEEHDIVIGITVDRADLPESFYNETKVCTAKEVPINTRLEALEVNKDGEVAGMTVDNTITLKNVGEILISEMPLRQSHMS